MSPSTPSTGELLLKAVRSLPDDEQQQLLAVLLGRLIDPSPVPRGQTLVGMAVDGPGYRPRQVPAELALSGPAPEVQPLGHLPPLAEDPGLKVLPVRLPAGDYERLRAWSKQHDFSMAVIVRTLVERFLAQQAAPPSSGTPGPTSTG